MTRERFKTYLIIALITAIGIIGFIGGRSMRKTIEENALLKSNSTALKLENLKLDEKLQFKDDTIKNQSAEIERLMGLFRIKDQQIALLEADLDSALSWLNFITVDSSYQFLQEEAYNYPGVLKFLFNDPQVRHIHSDYLVARNSEQIIPALTSQINNCKEQFTVRDSMASTLRQMNEIQQQQLDNFEKITQDNEKIIIATETQRDKEERRKNFWRFTSAVGAGVCVVLAAFCL